MSLLTSKWRAESHVLCVGETDQSQCALLQRRLGWFISPSVIGETLVSDAFSEPQEILSKVAGEEVVV